MLVGPSPRAVLAELGLERSDLAARGARSLAHAGHVLRSRGELADLHFGWGELVAHASTATRLRAGDVLGSGTVGTGCFLELNGSKITQNQWLKPGDEVVLEIERLGRLVNRIEEAPEDYAEETWDRSR